MTVTDISPQKHRAERFSVFVDGEFVFGMSGEDILYYHLSPGMEISEDRLHYLTEQVIFVKAREKALRYLGYRARTQYELERKLTEEPFTSPVIARVITLLKKYNYINDEQYAKDYVQSRMQHSNYGLYRIKQELKQKGINNDLIERTLQDLPPEQDEASGIQRWLRQKRYNIEDMDAAQKQRCIGALLRRGFSYAAVREALRSE